MDLRQPIVVCGLVALTLTFGCQPNQKATPPPAAPSDSFLSKSTLSSSVTPTLAIQFSDVAPSAGINWIPQNGEAAGYYTLLESLGSGCAIADYDQDGLLDLFIAGGGTFGRNREILPVPIALYRQTGIWQFTSVEISAQLTPIRHYHHGAVTADFDDDGFPDLLITGYGGLQFFRNQGDGTFVDVTTAAQLDDTMWSSAAAWGDLNLDGVLDLFVGHYANWSFENHPTCVHGATRQRNICAPSSFQGLPCLVYVGNGDGTFRRASEELGIDQAGKTLGVVMADLDDDGQLDVYVANDTTPNHLYERQSSGVFKEVGLISGVALGDTGEPDGSMGVDVGDLTGDGQLDLWVANFENQSFALYRKIGEQQYRHSSRVFGITAVGTLAVGFGTTITDFDGDGFEDIFCANGHINAPDFPVDRRQVPFLFWNQQGTRFVNVAPTGGEYLRQKHVGRGLACADIDRNGTPDLVITHLNEPTAVLRNETPIASWLSIRLIGRTSPRSAIGARVVVKTGERRQLKAVRGGGSYLSTSDLTLHFGLGDSPAVDEIEVHWPSGAIQRLRQVNSCQALQILESADSSY